MQKYNLAYIQGIIHKAIKKVGFEVHTDDIHIEKAKTIEHGHFATNAALLLAGKIGRRPREVGEKIIANLDQEAFSRVEIAGPGFINFWVEQNFYSRECQELLEDLDKYLENIFEIQKKKPVMVIEYSSPNIAKPLGAHHLLSTIIGDTLKKIYKKTGYKTISDNYLGDIGTQFGKLIYAIDTWGDTAVIEKDPINELLKLYVRFHNEAEKNPSLNDLGRIEYKKFEEGDKKSRALWEKIVEWSLQEINPLYERLDVHFDYMNGESFYEDKMEAMLKEGKKKGVFVDGNDGAWVVMPDDPRDPPAIVRKSDGASIYLTRDLTQMDYFEKTWHPDAIVWVVDVAQSFYFKQRFHAYRKLKQTNTRLVHVEFGRMQFKDGSMSTRKGNIVLLEEVLNEAEERALKLAQAKGLDLDSDEEKELARIMGIGAIKYNILSQSRTTNITFNWDKIMTFEGNSAPYLMYTATRAKSILRKSELDLSDIRKFDLTLTDNHETKLAIQLMMYPDVVKRAADEFKPNHIATYLYNLSQDFNTFYNALPIIKAESEEQKNSRLLLTSCVIRIMEDGLGLLGIEVPEKM